MALTVDQLLAWRPEALSGVVDGLMTDLRGLHRMQEDLELARPSTYWIGDDADGARAEHAQLTKQTGDLVAEVRAVAKATDVAEADMSAARDTLVHTLAAARALQLRVQHDPLQLTVDPEVAALYDADDPTALGGRAAELEAQIRRALKDAHEADVVLAGVLDSVVDGVYHPGSPTGPEVPIRELMKIKDPTPAQVEMIRRSLPRVGASDIEALLAEVAARHAEGLSPDTADLKRELSGVVGALSAYALWARKHPGAEPPLSKGQLAYLKKVAELWEDDVDPDGYRAPRENPLRDQLDLDDKDIANAILVLSDPDMGGGYDALPQAIRDAAEERAELTSSGDRPVVIANDEFFHLAETILKGDVPPGDTLAKMLADGVAHSASLDDHLPQDEQVPFASPRAEGMEHRLRGFDDEVMSDVLRMVARDPSVVDDLMSGTDLPDGMSSPDFMKSLLQHTWDDDGAGVASMIDAMDSRLDDPTDPDAAFNHLVRNLTDVSGEDPTFAELMNPGGPSVTEVNPAVTESLIHKLGDHLPEFEIEAGADGSGPLAQSDRMRLMMLIASDSENADLFSAHIQARQMDNVDAFLAGDRSLDEAADLGDHNTRLAAMHDAALIDAIREKDYDGDLRNADEAETTNRALAERHHVVQQGTSIINAVIGSMHPAAGTTTDILTTLMDNPPPTPVEPAPHHPDPVKLTAEWSSNGDHVSQNIEARLMDRLRQSGAVDLQLMVEQGDLTAEHYDTIATTDPSDVEDHRRTSAYREVFDQALPSDETFGRVADQITNDYDSTLTHYTEGSFGTDIEEILNSEAWPVGGTRSDKS